MASPKFAVGQLVDLHASQRFGPGQTTRGYKVLHLLPRESGEQLYRIKTMTEAYERIAKESELKPAAG
jgi:hypothetical protein